MKKCSKCGGIKSIDEFHKDKYNKDGLRCSCKNCVKKYDSKYYKIYYKKNRAKLIMKTKEYRMANPEWSKEYRKKNEKRIAKNNKEWREKRYHRYWTNATLSNHKRNGYIVNLAKDELEDIAKKITHCSICGIKLKWHQGEGKKNNSPTLDRINNSNELNRNNIQIICDKCNATKQDRTMKEFVKYCKLVVDRNYLKY